MPGQSDKKPSKRSFSGSHQRSWLWGHHAVTETIRAGKWPILEVFTTQEAFEPTAELLQAQGQQAVPIAIVSANRLEQLVRSSEHQSIVARLGPFPYLTMKQLLSDLRTAINSMTPGDTSGQHLRVSLPPLVVVCDRIQDAFNFGAILRCCDGAAAFGVIVSDKCQAEVTPHVARSSSGAVNYVPIARTDDLIEAVRLVKQLGSQVVAADSNATTRIWKTELQELTTLIVGSEAHGIHPNLLAMSDHRVCVPMLGRVTSLNAAVATGILLYEIRRQQSQSNDTRQVD
ncbi:MAG: 23S rRNA (guanosine(2251)-2'-O)-methyltransferase RlmB [Pirellulaceae bacterium]|nr:23S rRNA (guanosine(2251)-2'-O)-methyltransferase RlmB [Pirellulaceae bacterium]